MPRRARFELVRTLRSLAIVAGVAAGLVASDAHARETAREPRSLREVEARAGGRMGVFALDTGTGRTITHRADERFAMCSTFKAALAAAVLAGNDRGEIALDQWIPYTDQDLLEYAPVTRAHVSEGGLIVDSLLAAAVEWSDNTAANLLLDRIGGPAGLTRFIRSVGDSVTRLDRTEPGLNSNLPADPRDTTTPRAMVELLRPILSGHVLSPANRDRLLEWMRACPTGTRRLRSGLPADWTAGDKTGTGARGACNDVAIVWPPGRAPILVACYLSDGEADAAKQNAAHAAVARWIVMHWAGADRPDSRNP